VIMGKLKIVTFFVLLVLTLVAVVGINQFTLAGFEPPEPRGIKQYGNLEDNVAEFQPPYPTGVAELSG
jgi:hypothetical protein